MRKYIIKLGLYLVQIVRILLYPCVLLLSLFIPTIKIRLDFESKNLVDSNSKSFKKDSIIADYAFEVSSEGELEQVRPIITKFLSDGKYVELLYASNSVEKKCVALASEYENLRILRMPLASMFFPVLKGQCIQRWLSAKSLILCRYDFYPELLLYGLKSDVRFSLVSATLKGKKQSALSAIFNVYPFFDEIVLASDQDKERFFSFGMKAPDASFDFRILQILERVNDASRLLSSNHVLNSYSKYIETFEDDKIVFGSFWPAEAKVFDNESFVSDIKLAKKLVVLAPHHLDDNSKNEIKLEIKKFCDLEVYDLNRTMDESQVEELFDKMRSKPGILLNRIPAILCESYTLFDHAFIGGGHGRSIHSVLEPFFGASHIYCGPKVHRSTEYDFVKNNTPHFIHIVEKLEDVSDLFNRNKTKDNLELRIEIGEKMKESFSSLIKRF